MAVDCEPQTSYQCSASLAIVLPCLADDLFSGTLLNKILAR